MCYICELYSFNKNEIVLFLTCFLVYCEHLPCYKIITSLDFSNTAIVSNSMMIFACVIFTF